MLQNLSAACSLLHQRPLLISSAPDSFSGGHTGLSALPSTLKQLSCCRSLHLLLLSAPLPFPTPSWPCGCVCSFHSGFCSCQVLLDTFPKYPSSPVIFLSPYSVLFSSYFFIIFSPQFLFITYSPPPLESKLIRGFGAFF